MEESSQLKSHIQPEDSDSGSKSLTSRRCLLFSFQKKSSLPEIGYENGVSMTLSGIESITH